MSDRVYTIDEIKDIVCPIAERYGAAEVLLFGSYAKKKAKPSSDIDLFVEKGSMRSILEISGLRLDLTEALGKDVDVITANRRSDADHLLEDHVMIYARG
jgi:predicted nucleotidyltransferase